MRTARERPTKQKIFLQAKVGAITRVVSVHSRPTYDLPRMKVREILKLLRDDGWYVIITEGSHRQLKHPVKPGRTTVSGHPNDDLHPKTLKSILTQAGLLKR